MRFTDDQIKRLERAYRLTAEAAAEFRTAAIPITTSSAIEIGQALSTARDLLQSLVADARRRS